MHALAGKKLPGDRRKALGQRANGTKAGVERAFAARLGALAAAARAAELSGPAVDVSLPGRGVRAGRLHPMTRVVNELFDVFTSLGFDVAEGPEVELYEYNFDKLGFPPDHPAINTSRELCDRWGTPFFCHAESAMRMTITSAGPDKKLHTPDDETFAP